MRKKLTKLEWRSKDHDRSNILTLDNTANSFTLLDKVFMYTGHQSERLTISKHKYFYAPSEEYKSFVIRFKRTK
jgi:hypothetical protein